ncbi:MAG: zf-HC2 domain-containing protein [Planctomycetota bacterium]|nr:zf-HC2 domain-containing protein [Planctomycetota bacterium]
MVCKWAEEAGAYFDGELKGERENAAREHIKVCPECAKHIEQLRSLESLRNNVAAEEVEEKQWDSCWQKIKEETTRRILVRKKVHFIRNMSLISVAALLLLASLLWLVFAAESSPEKETIADSGTLEILEYSSEYTPMVLETENVMIIMMVSNKGEMGEVK